MVRDNRIDFLRFIGLSLIILAHVQAPFTLTQIRSFDVPLMIFISGLTLSGKQIPCYWTYVWKRTKRLIIPVWIFLAVYLSLFYFLQDFVLPEKYLTGKMILRSFLLMDDSIGYVWIIRVFMLMMLVTPLILELSQKLRSDFVYISFLILLLLIDELLYQGSSIMPDGLIKDITQDMILYTVAYSVPFALGVRLKNSDSKSLSVYVIIFLSLFLMMGVLHACVGKNPLAISYQYKFPPQPYYIIYGSLISVILWSTKQFWGRISNMKISTFIGSNSIWIYLWHMPLALWASVFIENWISRYLVIYVGALFLFYIQYKSVRSLSRGLLNKYLLG